LSGIISGTDATNSYIKRDGSGAGKLILSGANTYAGTTSITVGVVQAQNSAALGNTTSGTIIASSNAALEISGGSLSIPEGITISGTGLSGTPGAIRNILGTNAISGTISLTGNARINVDAGTLSLTSTGTSLSLVGNTLNAGVASGTSMFISGALTGSGAFTKDNTGILYLSGNSSTYSGAIAIDNGVVNIQSTNALGGTGAGTTVNAVAALQVQGGVTFAAEPITISGTGINNDGAIRNMLGSNILAGPITLNGVARINVDAGILSLTSSTAVALGTNNLNAGVASGTSMHISGALTGTTGALTKDNPGTLILSGTSSAYDGIITISTGVLNLQSSGGLGTTTGNTVVSDNATLQVQNSITSAEPISIGGLGVSSLGAIRSISGNNILTGNISLTSSARINVDAGILSMTTGTIAMGSNNLNAGVISGTSIFLSGLLTSNAGSTLTKDNTGSLFISGNNTGYAGAISVSAGTLNAQNNNALGATSGTTTVVSGATIQLFGNSLNIPEPITINGDGIATTQGAIRNPSGNNTWSGAITLGSSARIATAGSATSDSLLILTTVNTGGFTITADASRGMRLGGVVTGSGALAKAGLDTLVLNATNDYTGATTISAGAISLRNVSGLGGTGTGTTINSGAALHIVGAGYNLAEPFFLNSLGITGNVRGAIWIPSTSGTTTLSGLITNNTASRINTDIASGTNTLTISGGITNNAGLTLGGVGDVSITAAITGNNTSASNLTKDGAGKLLLITDNTYAGTTSITAGVVQIRTNDALGTYSGSQSTLVGTGAAIEINGSTALTIPEVFTLNGNGPSSTGAIRLIAGAAATTLTGGITAQTASTINTDVTVGTNTLTISTGGITNTGGLSFGTASAGGITISSAISGAGAITYTATGTGQLILSGTNTSYTGVTTINSGVVKVQNSGALGNSAVTTQNTIVKTGAALQIDGASLTIAEAITISGTGISNDGVIRNISSSTGTNKIAGPITLAADAEINSDANTLQFSSAGLINTGTYSLTLGGAGVISALGVIFGSGAITKIDAGSLILNAANTYTGVTNINTGFVNIQAAAALGNVSAGTTVSSGAALQVQGGVTFAAEPITISGDGLSTTGVIRNISGDNTLAGSITLAAISRINSDAGTLTFSNTNSIGLATYGLTVGGFSNTTVTGVLASTSGSTSATLTKDGSGTLILNGENTYTGATSVTAGIVQVQKSNALGSQTAGTGSNNTTVSDGAALQIMGTSLIIPEAITVFGTGISNGGVIRNFTGSTGTNSLSNTITLNSNARINVDAGTLSMTNATAAIAFGTYSLSAGVTSNTNFNISGLLTGSGELTKDNDGTITLSGANIGYSGAITVAKGVMNIQNSSALGTTDVATTVTSGAALQLQNNIIVPEQNIYINGTGVTSDGAIRNMSGANALSGTVNLSSNARINVDAGTLSMTNATAAIAMGSNNLNTGIAASTSLSLSGLITGSGSFTKDLTGTIIISGANTGYSGAITVSSGVMNIQNNDALGATGGGTTVANNAALQFQNGITVSEALLI
jgi:autotransporter-associated beta strand protein